MEDEDIAPNMYVHTADPASMGRMSCLYTYWNTYSCTGATFFPYRLDQLFVFGAISSSSILRPILYKTYYSMLPLLSLLSTPP